MKRLLAVGILIATTLSAQAMIRLRWYPRTGWRIETGVASTEMDARRDLWGRRALPARRLHESGVPLYYMGITLTNGVCFAYEFDADQKAVMDLLPKHRKWNAPTQLWVEKTPQEKAEADDREWREWRVQLTDDWLSLEQQVSQRIDLVFGMLPPYPTNAANTVDSLLIMRTDRAELRAANTNLNITTRFEAAVDALLLKGIHTKLRRLREYPGFYLESPYFGIDTR